MAEHTGRSGRDSEVDIWVVNADGTDGHAVTACRRPDCSSNFAPAWSPSGNEVAMWSMVRCGDGWGPSLRLLDLSTGDIRDVVSCVGSNGSRIAWSPDGRFLAFELHTDNGTGNIFTIAASGGSRTQVTSCDRTDCRWAYYPSWSPDGRWLLFAVKSEPEALFEVAEARPDGGEFKRLGIQGFMAAWQPVGAGPNTETTATPQGSSVCFESESTGDFDGDGVLDRVKLHALVPFERCSPDALETDWRFEIRVELASGTISTPFEDCPSLFDCELLGGSDLDGDGRDELAVILTNAATATTGLYRVAGSGVEPLKVEHPGDPDYLEPGPIVLGGNHDAISQAGFECLVKEARRVVVAWWAERDDGVSPYRLHLASLELRGDAFLVVATQDQKDVADLPALRGLCR
jgi:hypothetical protein